MCYVSGLLGTTEVSDVRALKWYIKRKWQVYLLEDGVNPLTVELWVKSTIYSNVEGGEISALWSDISPWVRPSETQRRLWSSWTPCMSADSASQLCFPTLFFV